jgi:hypothetical protein
MPDGQNEGLAQGMQQPEDRRSPEQKLIGGLELARATIEMEARAVIGLRGYKALQPRIGGASLPDRGEAVANIMLAFRHLEDARMRLGKAIQALEGGVSVYDKPSVRHEIERLRGDLPQDTQGEQPESGRTGSDRPGDSG